MKWLVSQKDPIWHVRSDTSLSEVKNIVVPCTSKKIQLKEICNKHALG